MHNYEIRPSKWLKAKFYAREPCKFLIKDIPHEIGKQKLKDDLTLQLGIFCVLLYKDIYDSSIYII
jgi:hypothetical protein